MNSFIDDVGLHSHLNTTKLPLKYEYHITILDQNTRIPLTLSHQVKPRLRYHLFRSSGDHKSNNGLNDQNHQMPWTSNLHPKSRPWEYKAIFELSNATLLELFNMLVVLAHIKAFLKLVYYYS